MNNVAIRQFHNNFSIVPAGGVQDAEGTVVNRTRSDARICPPIPEVLGHFKISHFAARAKAIFGDSKLMPNVVFEEREANRW